MLLSRFEQFERALKANGWTYDVGREVFRNRLGLVLGSESLLRLLPEMTRDELACYQEYRYSMSQPAHKKASAD